VLWAISDEIRAIGKIIAGAAAGRPVQMLIRETRIRGASHQNLMQSRFARYSAAQVTAGLRHAATVDRMIKGLVKGDVWDELLQLALRFAHSSPGVA
jgi:DNA polymerase-3 subunit delta